MILNFLVGYSAGMPRYHGWNCYFKWELDFSPTDSLDTAVGTVAKKAESGRDDLNSIHLELKYPNTNVTVLMSTLFGQTSHRHHFIPAIAEEIRNSDGERSVHDMFTDASSKMMQHSRASYQQQNPEYRTTNRKRLVLPEHLTAEEKSLFLKDLAIRDLQLRLQAERAGPRIRYRTRRGCVISWPLNKAIL